MIDETSADEGCDDRNDRRWRWGVYAVGAFVVLVLAGLAVEMIFFPEEYDARLARIEAEQAANAKELALLADAADTDAAVEREKGFHCLSAWDGSNRSTVDQVKAALRDPDSFEHIETSIYGNDAGEHGLWMDYRAQNGFGGMNVERIYARVDHESCEARVIPGGPGSE
tara:strand:+ start:2964 stop:3470 length:507 start_codon:yes stop_codon:yes gene_type:complete